MSSNTEIRRKQISLFLYEYGHFSKERLIRKSKDKNLYKNSEGDEDVYLSLKRFADHHKIKLHSQPQVVTQKENEYFESIDDNGESILKKMSIKKPDKLKELLLERREELSNELIGINQLLKYYE